MKSRIIAHSIKNIDQAKEAIKGGVDFVELDVSKRFLLRKFVIQHSLIKGLLGMGPIVASLLIPSFREKVFLDLKLLNLSLNFTHRFSHLLSTLKIKEEIRICGYHWEQMSRLAEGNNLLPFYTLTENYDVDKIREKLPSLKKPGGFSVHHSLISEQFMEEFKSYSNGHGRAQIWVYTVNDLDRARKLKKLGVDGIITDKYELLLENLK